MFSISILKYLLKIRNELYSPPLLPRALLYSFFFYLRRNETAAAALSINPSHKFSPERSPQREREKESSSSLMTYLQSRCDDFRSLAAQILPSTSTQEEENKNMTASHKSNDFSLSTWSRGKETKEAPPSFPHKPKDKPTVVVARLLLFFMLPNGNQVVPVERTFISHTRYLRPRILLTCLCVDEGREPFVFFLL